MASQRSTKNNRDNPQAVRVNRAISAEPPKLPPVKVPHPFQGFVNFVREQGVVGLGVGFIVGTSANTLIKSVVTNILTPIIGFATGGIDFGKKAVCLNSAAGVCKNPLNYGQVISDTITFLAILLVVYIVIKRLKLDRLDKAKE